VASCSNRLTIRAKVADAALLQGLRDYLLEPRTLAGLTETLSRRLNAVLDDRPKRQALKVAEREALQRKVAHLVKAIEDGSATPVLLAALKAREGELASLEADLAELSAPVRERLAVLPAWVRQQVADVAQLLADSPERAKTEFQRLGVAFTVSTVSEPGKRPFLRATGITDFSSILAGSGVDFPTTVASLQ
jgi:hypothetical protein